MADDHSLTLSGLCERLGVTTRTVRYYVQQGLLPSPGPGRGARYGLGHIARIKLIRALQENHLPLSAIREQLEQLTDGEVVSLLAEVERSRDQSENETQPQSAADYARTLLGSGGPAGSKPSAARKKPSGPPSVSRSTWERLPVDPDVEIHVRRPLSRSKNKRIDRLLAVARAILEGRDTK